MSETSWHIASGSRELYRITPDGRVIRNPDVSWDEAARAFWDAVERIRPATPPTPDLDAVVARVRDALSARDTLLKHIDYDKEEITEFYSFTWSDLRALLAAVARPAEARGERCTNPHNDTSDPNHHCWHVRETCCHCETSRDVPAAPRPTPRTDG